jgi:hypothetical protein
MHTPTTPNFTLDQPQILKRQIVLIMDVSARVAHTRILEKN